MLVERGIDPAAVEDALAAFALSLVERFRLEHSIHVWAGPNSRGWSSKEKEEAMTAPNEAPRRRIRRIAPRRVACQPALRHYQSKPPSSDRFSSKPSLAAASPRSSAPRTSPIPHSPRSGPPSEPPRPRLTPDVRLIAERDRSIEVLANSARRRRNGHHLLVQHAGLMSLASVHARPSCSSKRGRKI